MKKFYNYISDITPTIAVMPLMHNCDAKSFIDAANNNELTVSDCDVFVNEKLVYCFYGRPAYRIKRNYSTGDTGYFPVCYILNTKKLNSPYRIFPFDTGAFTKAPDMKKKYFHDKIDKLDYELPNKIDSARMVVEKFFGSNENYYLGKAILDIDDIPAANIYTHSYYRMIRDNTNSDLDDRLLSIEVIFNKKIKLNENNLLTVILPSDLMDDRYISDLLLNKWKIKPIVYFKSKGNPIEFHGTIFNEAKKFMENQKILKTK